jgi:hypothetical protein
MSAQLSLFSVGVRPPAYADLDGLLAGPGQIVRRAGSARLSILLTDPAEWRITALLADLLALGLDGEVERSEFGCSVRTQFSAELDETARRWSRGAVTVAPAGLVLDGPALRWWCLAAGSSDTVGYALTLGSDEASWSRVGSALAAAGVPGTFVRPRPTESPSGRSRPAYRIVGRRLRRLVELVGPAPAGASAGGWPGTSRPLPDPPSR